MKRMNFKRRKILKGAFGTAVTLPWFESFASKAEAAAVPPKRFIALYHPNGVFTPQWFPKQGRTESDFTLGPIHKNLEPWKASLLFTSGIDMKVAVNGLGEMHQRGLGAMLTGQKLGSGDFVGNDGTKAGYALGPSIDQVLVGMIGQGTPFRSLQLGVHTLEADVSGVVSYAGSNQPLLPQNDPRTSFRTLFGINAGALDKFASSNQSVLDSVVAQSRALQKRVSKADQATLERHLTLIRELEIRILARPGSSIGCVGAAPPPETLDFSAEGRLDQVAQLQVDLLLTAIRCDLTRVASLMVADAKNHIAIPHLGIRSDVHNLTHLADADPARVQVAARDAWVAGIAARILKGLQDTAEMDGSNALQNTLLFWGSDVSIGNTHSHDDMPFVLAGGGAGFKMGRYVKWNKALHNDLLVAILAGFGAQLTTFGDPAFCSGKSLGNLF